MAKYFIRMVSIRLSHYSCHLSHCEQFFCSYFLRNSKSSLVNTSNECLFRFVFNSSHVLSLPTKRQAWNCLNCTIRRHKVGEQDVTGCSFRVAFFALHSILNVDLDKSLNKNELQLQFAKNRENMNGNESCQVVVAFVSYFAFLSQMGNRTENFSPEKC